MDLICFDLEGPLSPNDNAYELMKLFPAGGKTFEIISRYDDLLTLEARLDYEPGDTLALIAPFLIYHGVKEEDIIALAKKARLTGGAVDLISKLCIQGWKIFCISTSYEQYASRMTQKVGIYSQNVASTIFPLNEASKTLCKDDFNYLEKVEKDILDMNTTDDEQILKTLDHFYWEELPGTNLGLLMKKVRPLGGQRKVEALNCFAQAQGKPLSDWIVIGDSITDFKMLQTVDQAGGLAIAFNANEYVLPYSTMSLASTHINDLWPVLDAWERGKHSAVEKLVKGREKIGGSGNRSYLHWLAGVEDIAIPLEIHKRIRRIVREEAAGLG